jgi:hypothetical protein
VRAEARQVALRAKGFLSEAEGLCLYELAASVSERLPCLEIGSYCGKSTVFLAEGCRAGGQHPLFSIDHHRGSEEQQPGQPYYDPDLYDDAEQRVNTLPAFVRTVRAAGLVDWVIPIVTESHRIGRYWPAHTLSLLFIDGGHSELDAFRDYHTWSRTVMPGGYLCIHDIFPDPADGGQAPYHVLQFALASGEWQDAGQIETLGVLRRVAPGGEARA